jgi:hypothetical protein
VMCVILVPLPPRKTPFAVKIINIIGGYDDVGMWLE